jgi:hypothetical protein
VQLVSLLVLLLLLMLLPLPFFWLGFSVDPPMQATNEPTMSKNLARTAAMLIYSITTNHFTGLKAPETTKAHFHFAFLYAMHPSSAC